MVRERMPDAPVNSRAMLTRQKQHTGFDEPLREQVKQNEERIIR